MNPSRLVHKVVCVTLCAIIFVAGCAGHPPNPIAVQMPGDDAKSTTWLASEMAQLDQDIGAKKKEKSTQGVYNIACFVGGFFLIVPWFLMDLKGAPKAELEALETRKAHLERLYTEKGGQLPAAQTVERPL